MLNFHYILYGDPEVGVIEDDFTCPYHKLDFTPILPNSVAICISSMPALRRSLCSRNSYGNSYVTTLGLVYTAKH
jgi:hypothetical protein